MSEVRLGVFDGLVLDSGTRSAPFGTQHDHRGRHIRSPNWRCQLHLVTDEQVRECWDEIDAAGRTPEAFLKIIERKGYLTPWQSHKLLKGDPNGYFLGGYRVLYKIASGSFGRVFRADDPRTGADVAIKVLRRRWSEDPHKVELFEREGRVGMSMHHPNIVRILAVNQDKATGQYYIVMEFVEGGNLRDFLAIRKKLDVKEALVLLGRVFVGPGLRLHPRV